MGGNIRISRKNMNGMFKLIDWEYCILLKSFILTIIMVDLCKPEVLWDFIS